MDRLFIVKLAVTRSTHKAFNLQKNLGARQENKKKGVWTEWLKEKEK